MNAVILVAEGVQDQEFWYPYYRLIEEEFDVKVVVSGKLDIKGKYGIPIIGTATIREQTQYCSSVNETLIKKHIKKYGNSC